MENFVWHSYPQISPPANELIWVRCSGAVALGVYRKGVGFIAVEPDFLPGFATEWCLALDWKYFPQEEPPVNTLLWVKFYDIQTLALAVFRKDIGFLSVESNSDPTFDNCRWCIAKIVMSDRPD